MIQSPMPICERDPWRFQYFEGITCPADVNVPVDDIDCHEWFPKFNWVYEKLRIARSQGLQCGTREDVPSAFPVFAKPNINLRGMGLDSRVVRSRADLDALPEGHMWMPLLAGEHISTDCAIVGGDVRWMRHAVGTPWLDGAFRHWVIESGSRPALEEMLTRWVQANMAGYTGMMNFETMGGTMIEAHLRFADQWCDIYGRAWIDALVRLHADGVWSLKEERRTGYSVPLFARHGDVPPHPPAELQAQVRAMPEVSSLQITFYPAKAGAAHPMPPGGFRLGIVNCWDLQAGIAARDALASGFPGVEMMQD
jgi:hypothetical protein